MNQRDVRILRDLARLVAEVAALPVMAERRALWRRHNSLDRPRAMVLVFPEGAWGEILPGSALRCESDEARGMEWDLRSRLYAHEHFDSDNVVEAEWVVGKAIHRTGWGLEPRRTHGDVARGAWTFDPVIEEPADLKKLRFPEICFDEKATAERLERAQELFGGILDVKLKGVAHVSFHLMADYTALRGLEETMVDMCENPAMLHDAMAFFEEGNRRLVQQYVDQNLLSLNNDSTYHSSGGVGYTDELPKPDLDPLRVRPCDMWASAESQELAQVSPRMHAAFALDYEKRLLAPFGLNGYGCCEDLTRKLDDVLAVPNMRRISISPWADVDRCAEKLGRQAIFSWKPNPAFLVGDFDLAKLEAYLRHAIEATRGCVFEMILKDTHTCEGRPERFDRWTRTARRLVEELGA